MFPTRRITTSGGDVFRDEFSLAFDGSNDFVLTTFEPDYIHTNATFAMWIKMNDLSGQQTMGSHNSRRWYFGFSGTNAFIGVQNANKNDITITPTPIAGQWLHYAVTAIDGTATVYINGVAMADTMGYTQNASTNPTTGFRFGARDSSGGGSVEQYMNANISEVVQYDKGLSAAEIKTIYNSREPYNHKEGVCSSNLQAWWRMGDGSTNNRRFQYIENSASSAGSKLITSSTFDSDEDGWIDYSSGTVARSTDISSHSGGAGVLKCVNDATNHWLGKTANITSGMESGKIYIAEGYVYIPSSWSGSNDIYMYSADQFGDTNINIGRHDYNMAQVGTKDEWQHIFYTFLCQENSGSGSIYLRSSGTSNLEDGDFVYFDDFKITEIDKLNSGVMLNMKPEDFEGESF